VTDQCLRNIDPSLFDRCGQPKFCICFVVLICKCNLVYFYFFQVYVLLIFFFSLFVCLLFGFFPCLSEINQITFDFIEGESELAPGFNVEFGGGGLALNFFLVEYAIILCMRLLFCIIFWAVIFIVYSFMSGCLLYISCLCVCVCVCVCRHVLEAQLGCNTSKNQCKVSVVTSESP